MNARTEKIRNMTPKDAAFEIAIRIIGALILFLILYPLYYVVICSFSEPTKIITGQVWLLPVQPTLEGYRYLLAEDGIWTGYRNTLFYSLTGTALSLLTTIPAAYALSRKDFKPRKGVMIFFMITMYFGGGLIPTYLLVANTLHMDNTVWVMIVPFCVSVYNLIVVRTYFENSLPADLWEAAQLDGCSNTRYLLKIAIPLSKSVICVVMLYYIVGKWNEYFTALIYISDSKLVPLQLVLRNILIMNETASDAMTGGAGMAAVIRRATLVKYTSIIVGTLPMMILYPFIQKYFEKGVMIGAIKG